MPSSSVFCYQWNSGISSLHSFSFPFYPSWGVREGISLTLHWGPLFSWLAHPCPSSSTTQREHEEGQEKAAETSVELLFIPHSESVHSSRRELGGRRCAHMSGPGHPEGDLKILLLCILLYDPKAQASNFIGGQS